MRLIVELKKLMAVLVFSASPQNFDDLQKNDKFLSRERRFLEVEEACSCKPDGKNQTGGFD